MKLSLTLSLPVLAVISVAGFSAPAFADDHCPDIPNGKWWGNASHAKIIKYVNKKHDGDWLPYIVKWDRQLKKMKRVFANDGVAVFKKRGLALRDAELLEYIQAIELRVSAAECLAERAAKTANLKSRQPENPDS